MDTVDETFQLYKKGKTIDEIVKTRGLAKSTVVEHFVRLIEEKGFDVDVNFIINPVIIEMIKDAILLVGDNSLSEIKNVLRDEISYDEIKIVRAILRREGEDAKTKETNFSGSMGILSVSEITSYIKYKLESDRNLSNLFVRGEVTNLRKHNSGHVYFSLKDEESQIKCAFFRRMNKDTNFELENGMKIIIRGDLEVYEPRGEYSIVVKEIYPAGIGALYLAFLQLKNKLEKEGLFLEMYKKPLPKFPKRIGIITSLSGAAIHDILNVIKTRYPIVNVMIAPCLVQGREAAISIVEAIKLMNEIGADIIILGRGGGSIEDLWCFNEEIVARAIFASEIPVVTGIGHETDSTIADFVADVRASTPTAAAERSVPDIKNILKEFYELEEKSSRSAKYLAECYKISIKEIVNRPIFKRPLELMRNYYRELDRIEDIIITKINIELEKRRKEIEILESKIITLNPFSVLDRGYGIVSKNGKIVKAVYDVELGDELEIYLSKGKLDVEVKEKFAKIPKLL